MPILVGLRGTQKKGESPGELSYGSNLAKFQQIFKTKKIILFRTF